MTNTPDHWAEISKRLRTSSAVVPALIFAALCGSLGTAGLIFATESASWLFQIVIAVGFLIPAVQIPFFTIFDRDRLQNEEHVERKMMIATVKPMIGDANSFVDIDTENQGVLIANPSAERGRDV